MSTPGGDLRPDRATGPKSAAEKLRELLERIREEHPPTALPLPPADAPAPPRPWSDSDDDSEGGQ